MSITELTPLHVYLAGKIAKNDWRMRVVDGLDVSGMEENDAWPVREKSLFGVHHYVGPYFISCDHGCYHGRSSHGCTSVNDCGGGPKRGTIGQRCRRAIHHADLVYAWVDDPTAYGTILEIGYALALGCHVVVAHPPGNPFRYGHWEVAPQPGDHDWLGHGEDTERLVDVGPLHDLWLLPQFLEGCADVIAVNHPGDGLETVLRMPVRP